MKTVKLITRLHNEADGKHTCSSHQAGLIEPNMKQT